MSKNRPFVLTIAGLDPSGGAGILADIKTFEQHRVFGLAINTANTIQTENTFHEIEWTNLDFVLRSLEIILQRYNVEAVKIGIVPSVHFLKSVVFTLKKCSPNTKIIWDTVLKSTTEFQFLTVGNQQDIVEILKMVDLITPNFEEILFLNASQTTPESAAGLLSKYCAVLLKGGHNLHNIGIDYLYQENQIHALLPERKSVSEKHGSGCVLSSAIAAQMALGENNFTACIKAKKYIENYLQSSSTKLGHHYV